MPKKAQPLALPTHRPIIARDLLTLPAIARELGRVYRAMRRGELPTQDGTRLAYVLRQLSDVLALLQLEGRIKALEDQTTIEVSDHDES